MYRFQPLLKQTIWGGDKIIAFKHLDTQALPFTTNIGESWEISGVKGSETLVADGPDAGKSLNQLVREQKGKLVGQKNYERFGDEFPLLVKFIDAHRDLSIQVHPNDEVARRHGHQHGKTEMWYCLSGKGKVNSEKIPTGAGSAEANYSLFTNHFPLEKPGLFNGLRQQLTPESYRQMVADGTITEALASFEVSEGDAFYIPAGRIHAIGTGCFVAEIQQTSDVTYRIYDYQRRDAQGNLRELHTQLAAEAIDYDVHDDYRIPYDQRKNMRCPIISCPCFTTAVYDMTEPVTIDYSDIDSFIILMAVGGKGTIRCDGSEASFQIGDTILLPATTQEVKVKGTVRFLEIHV